MDISITRRFRVVGLVFIVVGLVSAAAAHPALGTPIGIIGDVIFWPVDGSPGAPSLPTERLFAAIAGGLMTGWGTMLLLLGLGRSVAGAYLIGGLTWFLVDGTGSVLAGVPLNVLGNVPFLVLVAWATRSPRPDAEWSLRRSAERACTAERYPVRNPADRHWPLHHRSIGQSAVSVTSRPTISGIDTNGSRTARGRATKAARQPRAARV